MTIFVTPLICVSPYNWDLRYKIDTLSPNNKTCSPFITTGCFTPTCHHPEIEVSRLNWDSYSCFFLPWTVARLLAIAMLLTLYAGANSNTTGKLWAVNLWHEKKKKLQREHFIIQSAQHLYLQDWSKKSLDTLSAKRNRWKLQRKSYKTAPKPHRQSQQDSQPVTFSHHRR